MKPKAQVSKEALELKGEVWKETSFCSPTPFFDLNSAYTHLVKAVSAFLASCRTAAKSAATRPMQARAARV